MEGKFFPAIWAADFQDSYAALRSIGIVGQEADFCLAGVVVSADKPVIFEVVIGDPLSKVPVVLIENSDGLTGLWFGAFEYLSDTSEEAMSRYIADIIEERMEATDEAPTVAVFQWSHPAEVMQ